VGAVASAFVMVIFAWTKFPEGAWVVVFLVPTLVILFFRIHHHYKLVAHELSLQGKDKKISEYPLKTILLVEDVHAATLRMVNFVKSTHEQWEPVHIAISPEKAELVAQKWHERLPDEPPLVILESPFRSLTQPLVKYINEYLKQTPDAFVHVVMSQIVFDNYWDHALHANSSIMFKLALQQMDRVAVTDVAYQLHEHRSPAQAEENGEAREVADQAH
jgi:hypothetical protein